MAHLRLHDPASSLFTGICASAGILFTNIFGGTLFDLVGKGAPFFLIGAVNAGIMLFGLLLLRRGSAAGSAA